MSQIITNTRKMREESQKLDQLLAKFKSQKEKLMTTQKSLDGMWDGDANTQFNKAFHKDMVQFDNFARVIKEYANALNQMAENYDKAEANNVSIAQQRSY